MREILTRKRDIAAAVGHFRRAIAAIAPAPRKDDWIFPNGERVGVTTYALAARSARLFIGLPSRATGRIQHLFHLDRDEPALTPDVELTVPVGLDRRQSGVYMRDGAVTLLASRGSFSASRGKIPRERVFRYFAKWLIPARDGAEETMVIPVAAADAPALASDLLAFVEAAITFKHALREGEPDDALAWREPPERAVAPSREYLHGLTAHALETRLRELTHMSGRHAVCRNRELDMALVDTRSNHAVAIFEVETSLQPQSRAHAAVGRLLHFRSRYGDNRTRLMLALPAECKTQVFDFKGFFEINDIECVFRAGADFHGINDAPLTNLLDDVLSS